MYANTKVKIPNEKGRLPRKKLKKRPIFIIKQKEFMML